MCTAGHERIVEPEVAKNSSAQKTMTKGICTLWGDDTEFRYQTFNRLYVAVFSSIKPCLVRCRIASPAGSHPSLLQTAYVGDDCFTDSLSIICVIFA